MGISLVTGGNRGIGLCLCRQLAARGDQVIAAVREASPELNALGVEVVESLDVTDASAPARLGEVLAGRKLALLINNAGILEHTPMEGLDVSAVRRQLEVNAIAPLMLTVGLRGHYAAGAKVALVTSRMGSIADNGSGGAYGYRMSKAALNAAGKSLAIDLAGEGVSVAILHPGWVQTDMTGHSGQVSAEQSAKNLIDRIDALTAATSGTFWHANGEILPW